MTTEKPDPAALLDLLDQFCTDCVSLHLRNKPDKYERYLEKRAALLSALQPQGPTTDAEAIEKWVPEMLARKASADDAAVLEDIVNELTSAAEEQFRLKLNTPRYRKARAAVLARMSGVPEGWKMVPVEPTKEMLDMRWSHRPTISRGEIEFDETDVANLWAAILAAAPSPEVK